MTQISIPTVKYVTVTDHYTAEQAEKVTLKEVVTKPGFQRVFTNQFKTAENATPVTVYCVQYVEPLAENTEE